VIGLAARRELGALVGEESHMEYLLPVLAYLGGSVPAGLLVTRWAKGVDIREHGSGNIGTANVLRVAGAGWAMLVFLLDALKGLIPVLLARGLGLSPFAVAASAVAAVVGHNWSVVLGFRGGKGVATTLGVLFALEPVAAAVAVGVWVATVTTTGYASLGSMLGLAAVLPVSYLTGAPPVHLTLAVVLLAMAIFRHRANLRRLAEGRELRLFGRRSEEAGRSGEPGEGCTPR